MDLEPQQGEMATSWTHDLQDEATVDASDWDLEDALARAILGDVGELRTAPSASLAMRDEAEEERLIKRLHARLFPAKSVSEKSVRGSVQSRQVKSKRGSQIVKASTVRAARAACSTVEPQPRCSISPEKIDQMVARFRRHEAKRSSKIELLRQQQSATSVASSVSSDLLSPRSRELTRGMPSFQERQAIALATREREAERQRQRIDQQQRDRSAGLEQAIRTPCICGVGLRTNADHSRVCARFMDACEKSNSSSEIQRKKQTTRRTVDDMLRFQEQVTRKRAAMAEAQRKLEDQEATYTPQISRNSIKIYEELTESGRLLRKRDPKRPSSSRPTQPKLCAKSKLVLTTTKRRSSITSQASIGSRTSVWSGRPVPSHSLIPKAASFSESHWVKQAEAVARKDTAPATPPPPPFIVPWTNVDFDAAESGFILSNFDQETWFRQS